MEEKPAIAPEKPGKPPPVSQLPPVPPPRRSGRRGLFIIASLAAVILIASVVAYYIVFIAPYETTDDAFIAGNVTFVSPRVSGPVVRLFIDDNQRVKAGDPLLEIDDRNYQTQLAEARANLVSAKDRVLQARAQITVDQAKADQQQAAVASAQATADRSEADRIRYLSVESNAVSRSQIDLAQAQATSASANVEVARNQAKAAAAQVDLDRADLDTATSQVGQVEASLRQAELNLSYTKVLAPRDGRVTRRTVEQGAYVQTGQALLALVPDDCLGGRQFQGNATGTDEARPAGQHPRGCVPAAPVQGQSGQPASGFRRALQPAAARERRGQLRQGGAARAGENRF